MRINDLVKKYEAQARGAKTAIKLIRDTAQTEGRENLTETESREVDGLFATFDTAQRNADAAREIMAEDQATDRAMGESTRTGAQRTNRAHIGYEARTYRPDTDPHGVNFLRDVVMGQLRGDVLANDRLVRHMSEERVERPAVMATRAAGDVTTANLTGLVVPQYLTDMVANQVSPLRPFADLCTVHQDLPAEGMSVSFSKVTTGSQVSMQTAELGAIGAASLDDTLGTLPVQTAAGYLNVSRQAIDRGTGIEQTSFLDLSRKYAATLDSQVLNQAVTGVSAIAQNTAYTSASPTGAEMWPILEQADSKLEAALQGVAFPSHVVMHSRRWHWLASQVGTSFPFVGSSGVNPQQGAMLQPRPSDAVSPSIRAKLSSGLLVVVDNNISTTTGGAQDEVYVVASDESVYLFEDPNAPVFIRAEQPNAPTLGVLLVLYGYFAYGNRYANSVSKITGTGLVAPAGF